MTGEATSSDSGADDGAWRLEDMVDSAERFADRGSSYGFKSGNGGREAFLHPRRR